jgi:hypothetical protein
MLEVVADIAALGVEFDIAAVVHIEVADHVEAVGHIEAVEQTAYFVGLSGSPCLLSHYGSVSRVLWLQPSPHNPFEAVAPVVDYDGSYSPI